MIEQTQTNRQFFQSDGRFLQAQSHISIKAIWKTVMNRCMVDKCDYAYAHLNPNLQSDNEIQCLITCSYWSLMVILLDINNTQKTIESLVSWLWNGETVCILQWSCCNRPLETSCKSSIHLAANSGLNIANQLPGLFTEYICIAQIFGKRNIWQISHQKLLMSRTLVDSCLFAFFTYVRDIVRIWIIKCGKPPVIFQIYQGFPLPKIRAIWYLEIRKLSTFV